MVQCIWMEYVSVCSSNCTIIRIIPALLQVLCEVNTLQFPVHSKLSISIIYHYYLKDLKKI